MLNIFKKGVKTLNSDLETYVVRWNEIYKNYSMLDYERTAQFFSNEDEAKEFYNSLERAAKLLKLSKNALNLEFEKVKSNGL